MRIQRPNEQELAALRQVHKYLYPDWPDPYEAFDRLNQLCFGGKLPTLPIERGLMPYGHCLGQTACHLMPPRIAIGTYQAVRDPGFHDDVLLHEMVHAWLAINDRNPKHNFRPWCEEIERITLLLGLPAIQAAPVNPTRIDGRPVRVSRSGFLTRRQIAGWPHSIRATASSAT